MKSPGLTDAISSGLFKRCPISPATAQGEQKVPVHRGSPHKADLKDEPGAMATLIDLKLSHNSQFRDKPGGCAWSRPQ
jgi:hypothetical protein